jgi:hypothetical protein
MPSPALYLGLPLLIPDHALTAPALSEAIVRPNTVAALVIPTVTGCFQMRTGTSMVHCYHRNFLEDQPPNFIDSDGDVMVSFKEIKQMMTAIKA